MPATATAQKVLLVEDDPSSRNALAQLLKHYGIDSVSAGTAREAIALLERNPTCLVLDLMLPDADGTTVLEAVRRLGLKVHVAVTTGASDPALLGRARAYNPDVTFRKPVDLSALLGWLRSQP